MPGEADQRRLAAILVADVVGYSRMMAEDESGTLARLRSLRDRVIDPLIAEHGGRLVKLMGDGALVEFSSVSSAVACAIDIQRGISEGNHNVSPERRIELRIGINLGEVIVDGDDIYGDGVNVAARLEGCAEPGGIVLSGAAYDQARGRIAADFEPAGEQQIKNIPSPVRTYRLRHGPAAAPSARTSGGRRTWLRPRVLLPSLAAAAIAGVLAVWLALPERGDPAPPRTERSLADKPSVVVLPFDNLSGDPEQSYFSNGVTESIITDLSRVSGLLVIAWNTSSSFKDEAVNVQSVADELGVRYVVEGSVQRAASRVRINAQLIDGTTGYQLWAAKLDREDVDLFALQDEVANQIIDALEVELTQAERRAVARTYTDSLEAYDLYLRAWERYWQYNEPARREARRLLREALREDPEFARAQALMTMTYTTQVGSALEGSEQSLDRAYELARRAVELDETLPQVHWVLALVHMFRREYEDAIASAEQAIELDPNYADAYALLCWILQYSGEPERGLKLMETAKRLNPRAPFPYLSAEAETYFSLGRYQEAADLSTEALRRNPTAQRLRLFRAAALAQLGRIEEAEWEVEELLLLEPGLTVDDIASIAPYRDQDALDRLSEGLRQAGLPG